jgi:hypothetical protein
VDPVKSCARQQPHLPAIETGVHAVAVELDLVGPFIACWRGPDQQCELRRYPVRQSGGLHRMLNLTTAA